MRKMCMLGGIVAAIMAFMMPSAPAYAVPKWMVTETIETFYEKNGAESSREMVRALAPDAFLRITFSHSNGSLLILVKDARTRENGCHFYLIDEDENGSVDRSGKMCNGMEIPEDAVVEFFSEDAPFVFVKDMLNSFEFPKTTVSPDKGASFFDRFGGPQNTYEKILIRAIMLSPY